MAVYVSPILKLITLTSASITSVVSIAYIILCVIGLTYYFDCEDNSPVIEAQMYFWATIHRTYLQNGDCGWARSFPSLTRSNTIFVLETCILSLSFVNLITAVTLSLIITKEETAKYIDVYVFMYIGSWMATLAVDITLGTYFGIDMTYLYNEMKTMAIHIPLVEVLYQGAFFLMAISLKGFVIYAVQIMLICLILSHLYDCHGKSTKAKLSIQNAEAAFDQQHNCNTEVWKFIDVYPIEPFPQACGLTSYRRRSIPNTPAPLQETPVPRVPHPDYTPDGPRQLKSVMKIY